jgi:hypothetical protein
MHSVHPALKLKTVTGQCGHFHGIFRTAYGKMRESLSKKTEQPAAE